MKNVHLNVSLGPIICFTKQRSVVGFRRGLATPPNRSLPVPEYYEEGTPSGKLIPPLRFLAELAAAGEFKPVIDRRYPFEQIAKAHSYIDTGRKKGNVIITIDYDD
ncbi:MAG: zinc-binding dehydrogenase [Bacteroidota bacterium]